MDRIFSSLRWLVMAALTGPLLLSPPAIAAPVEVINSPGTFWEVNVVAGVSKLDRFLGDQFTRELGSVQIVRTQLTPEYDLARHLIYIDEEYTPVELYHEYAHKILDEMLIRRVAAIRYFNLRNALSGRNPELVLKELELTVADDIVYLAELQELGYTKMAGNLSRSIDSDQLRIKQIRQLLPDHYRYGPFYDRYKGESGLSLYQLIAPYHELFADTVSVLMSGSWKATYMAQLDRLQRNGEELAFVKAHPEMSQEDFLAYRAFTPGLSLKNYQFSRFEQESNYTQFAPLRSHIRELADRKYKEQPQALLFQLAQGICKEIEARLESEALYRMSLTDMNGRLIGHLK